MKKFGLRHGLWIALVIFGVLGPTLFLAADETTSGSPASKNTLNPEKSSVLSKSEVPVLKGDLWTTASQDSKVAYVWGVCSLIEVERITMDTIPELKVRNVSAVASEALANVPMIDIVRVVDKYYQDNPGKLDVPVLQIIWDKMVKTKAKTGVANRPWTAQQ